MQSVCSRPTYTTADRVGVRHIVLNHHHDTIDTQSEPAYGAYCCKICIMFFSDDFINRNKTICTHFSVSVLKTDVFYDEYVSIKTTKQKILCQKKDTGLG